MRDVNKGVTTDERMVSFQRNMALETMLDRVNSLLECAEQQALSLGPDLGADHPVVFIMGPHRSGSTLFLQWLAHSGLTAYPSNLMSRFFGAPVMGAHIQLLLTDPQYNFRNEILDFNSPITFESENGKTQGALAPNEFWYFWRRFLPFRELDWAPNDELLSTVDCLTLVNELKTLTQAFGKPFALKAMILNYNVPFLDSIFEKAVFVQIKRDPISNIASMLEARKRQLGSEASWYSFKIREYPSLKNLSPTAQCAGQWYFIDRALSEGMNAVDPQRKIVVQYEQFCKAPATVFAQLVDKLGLADTCTAYTGPKQFTLPSQVSSSLEKNIRDALSIFDNA